MSKCIALDGNYYLHRAFNSVASRKDLAYLEKNLLTLVLQMVTSDIVKLKGTHAGVVFDSARPFRKDIYPEYKAGRLKRGEPQEIKRMDGSTVKVKDTPGSFVKSAREMFYLAGIPTLFKKGYEGDDLLGCIATHVPGTVVVCTRDKDSAALVNERVSVYWPKEEKLLRPKDVMNLWKVRPDQMRDYLCLLGDKVDNIPGVPGFGPATAVRLLTEQGSIAKALKDPDWRANLIPHKKTLSLAKMLVTLKLDVEYSLDSFVIKDVQDELHTKIWAAPKSLKDLGEARKASSMKGLFG